MSLRAHHLNRVLEDVNMGSMGSMLPMGSMGRSELGQQVGRSPLSRALSCMVGAMPHANSWEVGQSTSDWCATVAESYSGCLVEEKPDWRSSHEQVRSPPANCRLLLRLLCWTPPLSGCWIYRHSLPGKWYPRAQFQNDSGVWILKSVSLIFVSQFKFSTHPPCFSLHFWLWLPKF